MHPDYHTADYPEQVRLLARAKAGDDEAWNLLAASVMPWALERASMFGLRGDERLSCAHMAVVNAVRRWDPKWQLTTYVAFWVHSEVNKVVSERHLVRIPLNYSAARGSIDASPHREDLLRARSIMPLENFSVPDTSTPGWALVDKADYEASVRRAILSLPERMKRVVAMRYYGNMNYKAISKVFGISKERVRQILAKAHERLYEKLKEK